MSRPKHLAPALALALALPVAVGCSRAGADDGTTGRPFQVGVVDRGAVEVVVEETGVVEPERQIVVKSPISGVVAELFVREGDRVRPGQRLARVVPDIAQANTFAELRSSIASAEIEVGNARREFERAEQLSRTGGVTQAELEQRRTALEQAENRLATAREQLRLVERSGVSARPGQQVAVITAPAAGVVIMRGVEAGETVVGGTSAFGGGTEMFTIADLSRLRIKAAINEVDIGKVKPGDSVALTVDAFPGDTVRGVVRLVPPAARQQERVRVFDVEIVALSDRPQGKEDGPAVLRPGMTANVRIDGPTRNGVVRIPVEAVLLDEGQPVVYRVRGAETSKVPVRLGLSDLSWAEVLEGVAPGDSIALEDPEAAAERAARVSD